jgi:hypothetical protein
MQTRRKFQSQSHVSSEKKMPTRDTTGVCEGECRDRVREGEEERARKIKRQPYSTPCPDTPPWAWRRNDRQMKGICDILRLKSTLFC